MSDKLNIQEEKCLLVLFRIQEGNVKAIVENLDEEIPYTTVASIMKNLEKKKYVESKLVGNAYLYTPAMSEDEFKKRSMNKFVRNYFDNSYKDLVNFFVEQKKLTAKELKDLIEMIENKK
jgi:predicted transcriptional regulator